jgi:5-methylthioadenosine/S-adenosylhomocysteine deaminase
MSTREPADLLIEPRWLLPVAPLNTALTGQALAVSSGRILAVGAAAELRSRFAPRAHLVRPQHALLPGLVNAHTSACHALLPGIAVHGPRRRWLAEALAPLERRCLSADFVREGTRYGIAQMLRAGITCFADLSFFPEDSARAAAAAHVRAAIGLPVTDEATAWAEGATAHLARAERLWDEYRAHPRIGLYFAPLAAQALSEATLKRVRRVADELEARIALRLEDLDGWGAEARGVEDSPRAGAHGERLERLQGLGLLRPGFTAIGTGALGRAGLERAAEHGMSFVSCPQAELRLGAPPAASAAGATGLGTDTPLAAGALDLLAEMRAFALVSGSGAAQALRLGTLGGAAALGLAGEIGSLESGKAADLLCVDLGARAGHSAAAIADAIVFGLTRGQVSDVWSAGRAAVSEGRLLAFDEEELAALPARWAERLQLEAAA